jgi:competence ComEA-like helix-hairpin-helix protein
VDGSHPEGRWEVLDRCRLATNAPTDGDSFRILHRGREYGMRLYFVDCPETDPSLRERIQDQAAYFGIGTADIGRAAELAAKFTVERLSGREFTVQTRWQNGLGRSRVARFYCEVLAEGHNLAEDLVANGLARVHGIKAVRPDGTHATTVISHLKNLELSARAEGRGLWNTNVFARQSGKPARPETVIPASPPASVDLNWATYEELQKLPGIGPKLAERILARRPFQSPEDLTAVPGIGSKTLERLRPLVRVSSNPPPAKPPAPR